MKIVIKLFTGALFLISCTRSIDSNTPLKCPDPYAESFWGKNIKAMLIDEGLPNRVDTFFFDTLGNIVQKDIHGYQEKRIYDSFHCLRALYTKSDVTSNYFIEYNRKVNKLYQVWRRVSIKEWPSNDSTGEVEKIVEFTFDKLGKVIKENDTITGEYSVYSYSSNGLLQNKVTHFEDSLWNRITYLYDSNGIINKISFYTENRLLLTHYFSDGLLDSTVYKELYDSTLYDDEIKRYRFLYY